MERGRKGGKAHIYGRAAEKRGSVPMPCMLRHHEAGKQ